MTEAEQESSVEEESAHAIVESQDSLPKEEPRVVVVSSLPVGFTEINSSKMLWSPRLAFDRGAPDNLLQGFIVSLDILGADSKKPFEAFMVFLTKDALCIDRHGRPIRVGAGEDVFVKMSYEFEPWIAWSMHPELVFEIAAIPIAEREWESGDKCFTYKWGVGQKTQPRAMIAPKTMARFASRR